MNETNNFQRPKQIKLTPMKEMAHSIAEVEAVLIETINYGDYLEENIRLAEENAIELENEFNQAFERALNSPVVLGGSDAKKRETAARNMVSGEWKMWRKAKAQTGELKGYAQTNHSKTEALRTILSGRKTVFEKTYSNPQT